MAAQTRAAPQSTNAVRPEQDETQGVEEAGAAFADATQQAQGAVLQAVRQGQDSSLRALQTWADFGRSVIGPAPGSANSRAMVNGAFGLFETMLGAQRRLVDELIAGQRTFANQLLDVTDSVRAK